MRVLVIVSFLFVLCVIGICHSTSKKGILIVAFGTSVPEARKVYDAVDRVVKGEFPGASVRWAYTSRMVREKLREQGVNVDSPEMALCRMLEEGVEEIGILSLHVIPGEEYHELKRSAELFSKMSNKLKYIVVSPPLLSSYEDLEHVAQILLEELPKERTSKDGVIFMGHGTSHPAGNLYVAIAYVLNQKDPNVFLATVEGWPKFEEIIPKLRINKVKKVYLIPFMAVAGDHVLNDMAGEDPSSWKSILEKEGFKVVPLVRGLAESNRIIRIWLEHLKGVFPINEK
ncbi:MAG: sirohydrochlorin cobaltochelatase [Candidatus Bathyarchaeia archaeon]